MSEKKYGYSLDEEHYQGDYATRGEAIAEGHGDAVDQEQDDFWTGEVVPFALRLPAWQLIELAQDCAGDQVGEASEGWLDKMPPEQRKDLEKVMGEAFLAWCKANGHEPKFWGIDDIQRHLVTAEEPEDRVTSTDLPDDNHGVTP